MISSRILMPWYALRFGRKKSLGFFVKDLRSATKRWQKDEAAKFFGPVTYANLWPAISACWDCSEDDMIFYFNNVKGNRDDDDDDDDDGDGDDDDDDDDDDDIIILTTSHILPLFLYVLDTKHLFVTRRKASGLFSTPSNLVFLGSCCHDESCSLFLLFIYNWEYLLHLRLLLPSNSSKFRFLRSRSGSWSCEKGFPILSKVFGRKSSCNPLWGCPVRQTWRTKGRSGS